MRISHKLQGPFTMLIELMVGAEHLRWTDEKIGLHTPLMNRNKWV